MHAGAFHANASGCCAALLLILPMIKRCICSSTGYERGLPVRLFQHAQEVQASINAGALRADLDAVLRLQALASEAATAESALLRQAHACSPYA